MLKMDIELHQGEFSLKAKVDMDSSAIGVFGTSGSGKTTFLNTIAGLIDPDSGYIHVQNQRIFDHHSAINLPPYKRKIGYVFQDSQLFPHLSVNKNLHYGYQNLPPEQRRFVPEDIIHLLKLEHLLKLRPGKLSGGEKQRVAIGRAILASPRLLLMDEPLASLDSQLKQEILPFLNQLIYELKIPILYVSHDLNELLQLTSDIMVLEKGEIIKYGNIMEVLTHERVFNLSKSAGFKNHLKVKIVQHYVAEELTKTICKDQFIHLPLFSENLQRLDECTIQVRPQDIALTLAPIEHSSFQNQIPGKIKEINYIGRHALLKIDIGCPLLVEVSLKSVQSMSLKKGQAVFCLIKAHSFSIVS